VLNWIWLGLVAAAVVLGGLNGKLDEVTTGAFDMARTAVDISIGLIGIMALWLGIMRLAERSGLVKILARLLRPLMTRLFPDVPPDHPAMGSMLMNIAANMLGLANAATPLGLRAMKDLERLNPRPGTATNAMCTFLAVNTSSVQLIPATAIAILASAGSKNPTAIVGTAFIATLCSTAAGIASVKFLEKLPWFRLPSATPSENPEPRPESNAAEAESAGSEPAREVPAPAPLTWLGMAILAAFAGFFAWIFAKQIIWPNGVAAQASGFVRCVHAISLLAVPFLLSFFPLYAHLRKVPVYEEFTEGAKEGFQVAIKIIPYLVAILVGIGMFRSAGGIDMITAKLGPFLETIGFPSDLLPMVAMRPLSGSGTMGIFAELVHTHGPDSLVARMAASIFGSTETTFYVVTVYFGAVAIRKTRHAIAAGLIADLTGVIAAVVVCRMVFA
jgi:spore maturation protein SpmA